MLRAERRIQLKRKRRVNQNMGLQKLSLVPNVKGSPLSFVGYVRSMHVFAVMLNLAGELRQVKIKNVKYFSLFLNDNATRYIVNLI